jgi:biotin synthase
MQKRFYNQLIDKCLAGGKISEETARKILSSDQTELIALLHAAFDVRRKYFGKDVMIHIINNAQNGYCPEDCHYCAQAQSSDADIEKYAIKSDKEILREAKTAYEKGAFRYCMVFSGRGPSQRRVEHLAQLIRAVKSQYPIEVCVSAGLLDRSKARILKDAGLDRLNHNLNTSARHYPKICTTHTYEERIHTLQAARQAGLQICSGVILGMGENADDVLETAYTLRKMKAESIPVNFFIPIRGVQLKDRPNLSPEYCLRVLCLYRFLNPSAEIRIAAGRELHLRSMEVMALYPANSLFLDGYLNAKGEERARTFQMIKDAGFRVRSEYSLDELIANETSGAPARKVDMKDLNELRPTIAISPRRS